MIYIKKKGNYHVLKNVYSGKEVLVHETLGHLSVDYRMQIDKKTGVIRAMSATLVEINNLVNYRAIINEFESITNGTTMPNSNLVPTSTSEPVLDKATAEAGHVIRAAVDGTLSSMG